MCWMRPCQRVGASGTDLLRERGFHSIVRENEMRWSGNGGDFGEKEIVRRLICYWTYLRLIGRGRRWGRRELQQGITDAGSLEATAVAVAASGTVVVVLVVMLEQRMGIGELLELLSSGHGGGGGYGGGDNVLELMLRGGYSQIASHWAAWNRWDSGRLGWCVYATGVCCCPHRHCARPEILPGVLSTASPERSILNESRITEDNQINRCIEVSEWSLAQHGRWGGVN